MSESYSLLGCWKPVAATALVTLVFQLVGWVVDRWYTPRNVRNPWKWKNILVSFLHSSVSGTVAVLCFYLAPSMAEDVVNSYTFLSLCLVCFSCGYFIYDAVDMMRYTTAAESWELLLHHTVVLTALPIALITQQYICYVTMGLLQEVNSLFLHLRQLFNMYGVDRESKLYRLNSLFNLGTYIMFRIATVAWMSRWLLWNRDLLPFWLYSVTSIGMAVLTVMNTMLFCRLLYSDFWRRRSSNKDKLEEAKSE